MQTLPLRLLPGQDLRRALEGVLADSGCGAAFVLSGIGSLSQAHVRFAGADAPTLHAGNLEILTLSGTIATNGGHLHAALATADGTLVGGHVGYGCTVRTTAELLLALLPDWRFSRTPDALTGCDELVITGEPAALPRGR